ncbi:MAG TPA: AI-2E family transporter [Bacteriovoracaceae bacterium]|nr:AI-2E family transporter [Bacteriovoracaceae bacterium]
MKKNQIVKVYLFFAILIAALAFMVKFPRLTLPFGFSYILYLMINPVASRILRGNNQQRIIYSLFFTACACLLVVPLVATLYNAETDFKQLLKHIPELRVKLQFKYLQFRELFIDKTGVKLSLDPVTYIMRNVESQGANLLSSIPTLVSAILEWMLLVPLFLYFFFKESKTLKVKFMEFIPNSIFEKTYVLFSQFNTKFGEYIIAKFIEATILGSLVTLGLILVSFPYPFILGIVAGVTNILPYVGPIIGFVPAIAVALLSQNPDVTLLSATLIYLIANAVDMVLVFPLLVSKIVNLHPILVVVSVLAGGQIGGAVGMIVVIPMVAFIQLLFKEIYQDLNAQ